MDRQRIDKWLWHARVVRTRTAAAALVTAGRVRLNGQRNDSASQAVRIGDVVTVALDRVVRKCLAKDPEDRWQNAADLGSEIQWIAEGASQAGTTAPGILPAM